MLLDANLYISVLLPTREPGTIAAIFDAALLGAFALLIPERLPEEVRTAIASKPYLAARVDTSAVDALLERVSRIAEIVPTTSITVPRLCRDPEDDYLLATALLGDADYLVSGDRDLLEIGRVGDLTIVSPLDFVALLG